jgi:hypothetical protein
LNLVMKRITLLLLLALALIAIVRPQPSRSALAMCFDGRIVPFAGCDNRRRERAWPEADEATDPIAEIRRYEVRYSMQVNGGGC